MHGIGKNMNVNEYQYRLQSLSQDKYGQKTKLVFIQTKLTTKNNLFLHQVPTHSFSLFSLTRVWRCWQGSAGQ